MEINWNIGSPIVSFQYSRLNWNSLMWYKAPWILYTLIYFPPVHTYPYFENCFKHVFLTLVFLHRLISAQGPFLFHSVTLLYFFKHLVLRGFPFGGPSHFQARCCSSFSLNSPDWTCPSITANNHITFPSISLLHLGRLNSSLYPQGLAGALPSMLGDLRLQYMQHFESDNMLDDQIALKC